MIVLVRLANEGPRTADDLMRRFETEETVIEAWQITGEHDFAVRMVARDMTGYDELTRRLFVENDAVAGFQTLMVLRQTKTPAMIPIGQRVLVEYASLEGQLLPASQRKFPSTPTHPSTIDCRIGGPTLAMYLHEQAPEVGERNRPASD